MTATAAGGGCATAASCEGCCSPELVDFATNTMLIFASFLVICFVGGAIAITGAEPPNPSVHWPGHSWIHFMKRLHVIMSIGCFLMNLCACFFSIFALHRTLAGGFDTRARSAAEVILRELEFEYVAVSSYFFAGAMLLMGPVGIRCFCMVQQGLRSDTLAASVMRLPESRRERPPTLDSRVQCLVCFAPGSVSVPGLAVRSQNSPLKACRAMRRLLHARQSPPTRRHRPTTYSRVRSRAGA